MKHEELAKFTHKELFYLQHAQLELGKLEALTEIQKNKELPLEIRDKFFNMCLEVLKASPGISLDLPSKKGKISVKTILMVLAGANTIHAFITNFPDFVQTLEELVAKILNFFGL